MRAFSAVKVSFVVKFNNLMLNLLQGGEAGELVAPRRPERLMLAHAS